MSDMQWGRGTRDFKPGPWHVSITRDLRWACDTRWPNGVEWAEFAEPDQGEKVCRRCRALADRALGGYQPGDRVYRWWDSGTFGSDAQPLTIVRKNRQTVTVRTDRGSEFRMDPNDIAGYWNED